MTTAALAERIEMLEQTVHGLVTLPGRMEAVEGRLTTVEGRLVMVEGRLVKVEGRLATVEVQIVHLREEMRSEFSAIRGELGERFEALYERGEDTRRYMRVLHEEVIDRIARIGEGPPPSRCTQ